MDGFIAYLGRIMDSNSSESGFEHFRLYACDLKLMKDWTISREDFRIIFEDLKNKGYNTLGKSCSMEKSLLTWIWPKY